MKITQADIAAIRAAVKEHAPGRRTIEVGVRAGTIDSKCWSADDELEDTIAIAEIVGQPKEMGMVLDLYVTVPTFGICNLDAQWVAETRWNVFDPFAWPPPSHGDH